MIAEWMHIFKELQIIICEDYIKYRYVILYIHKKVMQFTKIWYII